MATNAYCVKCKAKRDMRNESKITMKNGLSAATWFDVSPTLPNNRRLVCDWEK